MHSLFPLEINETISMENQSEPKIYPDQRIHFVGIGGFGLSAIARVLLGQGYRVTGSDRKGNTLTEALARDGAAIFEDHDAVYVDGADALIISSAVPADHVEVAAAQARGIPIYKRQDIIADLMRDNIVIAVAGTHGKTTTTAMIVHILRETGFDPSYIVGGIMVNTGTNAGVGSGYHFVIEADEYDNMFHGLRPNIIVLTNVEYDHPDFFKSLDQLRDSFEQFLGRLSLPDNQWLTDERNKLGIYPYQLIACGDSPLGMEIVEQVLSGRTRADDYLVAVYGVEGHQKTDYKALNIHVDNEGFTSFDFEAYNKHIGQVRLLLSGTHNVQNALAALLATNGASKEVSFEKQVRALASFQGTGRRFDLRGEVGGVAVIDDYAHHPTAIRATLQAVRQRYPDRDIWAVWQPHTYSRTQALMDEYVTAFADADHVLVTDIYAARENPISGVNSAAVVAAMGHPDARYTPSLHQAVNVLNQDVRSPAAIIIMSAGDAPQIGADFLKLRRKAENETLKPAP